MKPLTTEENDERELLFSYTKRFAFKVSQIVISSRSGSGRREAVPCKIKPDWFNLNIIDKPGNQLTERREICNKIVTRPVCVEISLETLEEERMVLETWSVHLFTELGDVFPKVSSNTVYNQMGILLKSLLSVTRVVPAYKLSQRQGPETYTILFRMYDREPDLHCLGEGCKQVRIGQICTPIGTLQLSVAYRVKMTITPTQPSNQKSSMMLKSDHFDNDLYPRLNRNQQGDDKLRRKTQPIKHAFADPRPPRIKEPIAAFRPGGVLWHPAIYYSIIKEHKEDSTELDDIIVKKNSLADAPPEVPKSNTTVALVDEEDVERNRTRSENSEELTLSDKSSSNENLSVVPRVFRQSSRRTGKPVYYPFATPTPKSELIKFYRECVQPPELISLLDNVTPVKDIAEQLVAFEEKAKEFDELVESLCDSSESDN